MMANPNHSALTPVLMLVPYFAPQTHAAMFRAHKLAKYLPSLGYRPVVVTTDINYLYNENPELLEELPPVVQVHRARFIEPTLRGLRMALGGRDRTFAALKRQPATSVVAPAKVAGEPPRPTKPPSRSWAGDAVRLLGEWPDRHWTWSASALQLCRRLIREQGIKLIYTSAVPVSPLNAAAKLQREFDLKWVADFRDPVGYGRKHSASGFLTQPMEQQALRHAMASADAVTGLADSYGSIFFDLYALPESRYHFIPTGLDEAYLPAGAQPERDTGMLLHVGEVMPNQSRYTFEVMARARSIAPEVTAPLRLVFVGRREVNEPLIRAMTQSIGGWPYPVEFIDHVPQAQVYAMVQRARACLLIPGRTRYWWTNFAKLVDYLALGAPVIADVPPVSEAREELGKAGQGFFFGGENTEADAEALVAWLRQGSAAKGSTNTYGRRYTAKEQARAFAAVFDKVLPPGAKP